MQLSDVGCYMRSLYAAEFEIAPHREADRPRLPRDVQDVVYRWIQDWYKTRMSLGIQLDPNENDFEPVSGHQISTSVVTTKDSDVSRRLIAWSYPDVSDGNLLWHSSIEISGYQGEVEISYLLRIESTQFYISPFFFTLRRPSLIPLLLQTFACHYGGGRLYVEPQVVPLSGVPALATRLRAKARRLPLVLISRNPQDETLLVDPSDISSTLCGICETYVLADKWASYEWTDHVGKTYSCYNGAVRIYWPDFGMSETPYSPVYLPAEVRDLGTSGLKESLFRQMAAISAFRWVRGPVATDAQEFLDSERSRQTEELKLATKERGDYEELSGLYAIENEQLQTENIRLKDELNDIRTKLDISEQNLKAVWSISDGSKTTVSIPPRTEELPSFPLVIDAVKDASSRFSDTLLFLESSFTSAEDSPFKQPDKVARALLAMHEVCGKWRESKLQKKPIGSFEQNFLEKGFIYKAVESQTSTGKWREEYEVTYKERRVSIEQHLALGKGGPDTCLRIHFFADEDSGKFVIAHTGRHKTNTST